MPGFLRIVSKSTLHQLAMGLALSSALCIPLRAQSCWPTDVYTTPLIIHTAQPISTPVDPTQQGIKQAEAPFPAESPILNMVALGTSLTWGDGLIQQDTFRYKVADWLAQQTGRPVQLTTFAHSMALLTGVPQALNPAPTIGVINEYRPNVEEQATCAANEYKLSIADLVILDGCINDVNAVSIVAPWTQTPDLIKATNQYCDTPMQATLAEIKADFPKATIVVVGYYPLVTEKSTVFGILGHHHIRKYAEQNFRARNGGVAPPRTSDSRAAQGNRMIYNSEVFYQLSKNDLNHAVQLAKDGGQTRVFFAGLPEDAIDAEGKPTVDPLFAYGAAQTHEWMVPIKFLWWVFDKDDTYHYRYKLCNEYISSSLDAGFDRIACQVNAGFHPNPTGAGVYATTIESEIPAASLRAWGSK